MSLQNPSTGILVHDTWIICIVPCWVIYWALGCKVKGQTIAQLPIQDSIGNGFNAKFKDKFNEKSNAKFNAKFNDKFNAKFNDESNAIQYA